MKPNIEHVPRPRPLPIIGNVKDIDPAEPTQSLMRLAREFGPVFQMIFPGQRSLIISSHALVKELSDERRFHKVIHPSLKKIRDFAGDGLFTAYNEEPNWGLAHRVLLPAFGAQAMRHYFDPMLEFCDQMLVKWARLGPREEIDVADNFTRLTLDTIAMCGFGYRFNSFYQKETHPFVEAMVRALAETSMRTRQLPIQARLRFLAHQQFTRDVGYMNQVVDEVIAERRTTQSEERDLLALMLAGRDPETGAQLDDVNIRYQMVTFLIAGHETTSGWLSFATHFLLANPDVLARAQEEVDRVLGDDTPRFEHLASLTYIDQILRESLRLWPTAPAFAVSAKAPTTIGGKYEILPSDALFVLLPMLHRDPTAFADPERFDPDRFSPERRDLIPEGAYKPFGTGQRACIGRAFATQEATLVIATMLQRFELIGDASYQLKVKETLTLKPEGLRIRVRERKRQRRTVSVPAAVSAKAIVTTAHGTPLLVLFGSNSGGSEAFARRIAGDAEMRGYATTVAAMDSHVGKIPAGGLIAVTASYNGLPPDNARRFCEWLDQVPKGSLATTRFSVVGCGHRDWAATYQSVPRRVEAALLDAGAVPLTARGEADARGDFFGDFDRWYAGVWPAIDTAFAVQTKSTNAPLYTITFGKRASAQREVGMSAAEVVENRELVDMRSPLARSKRHLVLQLPAGISYQTGDYLAVLPENSSALVARVAKRFGLDPEATIELRTERVAAASLPVGEALRLGDLLGGFTELSAPATQKQVERLLALTRCPPEKAHLAPLAGERYAGSVLAKRLSLLDLLELAPACEIDFAEFLELLPPLKPRLYSIASSALASPNQCALTVAVVDADAWSGLGRYQGVTSSYLARAQPGDRLLVQVRTPNAPLRMPDAPLILICAGSGIAPFRAFVEERAWRAARGETLPEALLFFGCDHPDVDFLYRQELEARAQVVSLRPTFFKAPHGDELFVQHRLWRERADVQRLLAAGAHVFVCGDGARMEPAVRDTLMRIHADTNNAGAEDTAHWLDRLIAEHRYVKDVFA